MIDINLEIKKLVDYAINKGFISERDRIYGTNKLLEVLRLDSYDEPISYTYEDESVEDILDRINHWAVNNNLVENDSVQLLDLFDTEVISQLIQMPSIIEDKFYSEYNKSPKNATEYYYNFAKNTNYIREKRVEKDVKWQYPTEYGTLDMTINLSKPEKDPRLIAKAKNMKSSNYPKCLLCKENEGYEGGINHPARGNHRIIGIGLADEQWYLQYSPYVYYNEHCIVFKAEHEPMKITKTTFRRLLDFTKTFPHYFIGSNADLPIVGGSILSHDHFQGGNYDFAMAKAIEENFIQLKDNIEACTLKWPMSVIRLKGKDIDSLVNTAYHIFLGWKDYSDPDVEIYSHTDEVEHNTITPIARCRDGIYELDLVLRNNKTTEKRPYGLYHAREEYHNIKKENIGLIEVMGLAVLPSRLKLEIELLKEFLLEKDIEAIENHVDLEKHSHWARDILEENELNADNISEVLNDEIGKVFLKVLKDAGVFKDDDKGAAAFLKCRNKLFLKLKD